MMRILFLVLMAVFVFGASPEVRANANGEIAIVVNDGVITKSDLDDRLRLIMISSGLPKARIRSGIITPNCSPTSSPKPRPWPSGNRRKPCARKAYPKPWFPSKPSPATVPPTPCWRQGLRHLFWDSWSRSMSTRFSPRAFSGTFIHSINGGWNWGRCWPTVCFRA